MICDLGDNDLLLGSFAGSLRAACVRVLHLRLQAAAAARVKPVSYQVSLPNHCAIASRAQDSVFNSVSRPWPSCSMYDYVLCS